MLLINTSGPHNFVAFFVSQESFRIAWLPDKGQSDALVRSLEDVVQDHPIEAIGIGIGPGSFIGTRIGVITAKTLSFAENIPLLPFCSLKLYVPNADGAFAICLDGKRNGAFVLSGKKYGNLVTFDDLKMCQYTQPDNLSREDLNLKWLYCFLNGELLGNKGKHHSEIQPIYSLSHT